VSCPGQLDEFTGTLGGTVIACDLAAEELGRLRAPVPRDMQKRLITIAARFPEQLYFTDGSLSAILAAQVSISSMERRFDRRSRRRSDGSNRAKEGSIWS
jgi:hypothetical protein